MELERGNLFALEHFLGANFPQLHPKIPSGKTKKNEALSRKKRSFFNLQAYNIYEQTFTETEWRTKPPPNSNLGKT